ncbi:MAG: hypothetical protein KGI29_03325 [Pseudomonadota bacterium]|nr:hypothetical protein [Pseudomonadota bacterium]MDE3037151.1 hypothetical protein [Pseudomonadota bacterium]
MPEIITWLHWGTSSLAAFLASLVECVEALTIVLAVGATRGWRSVLVGTAAGLALLVLLVAVFNPLLGHIPIPITWLQITLGGLLFLFGMTWLRKAVLRAAGRKALHDQALIYQEEISEMEQASKPQGRWDWIALITGFKAIVLEGIEVVFIVVAVGAAQASLIPAALGAVAAVLVVALLGILLHRPLMRIPENSLKFGVGVILSAFGIFWIGKGSGFEWFGGDLAILGLMAGLMIAAVISVGLLQRRDRHE